MNTYCLQTLVRPLIIHGEGAWVKHKVIVYVWVGNLWENVHIVHNMFGDRIRAKLTHISVTISHGIQQNEVDLSSHNYQFDVFEAIPIWYDGECLTVSELILMESQSENPLLLCFSNDDYIVLITNLPVDFLLTCLVISCCLRM